MPTHLHTLSHSHIHSGLTRLAHRLSTMITGAKSDVCDITDVSVPVYLLCSSASRGLWYGIKVRVGAAEMCAVQRCAVLLCRRLRSLHGFSALRATMGQCAVGPTKREQENWSTS